MLLYSSLIASFDHSHTLTLVIKMQINNEQWNEAKSPLTRKSDLSKYIAKAYDDSMKNKSIGAT